MTLKQKRAVELVESGRSMGEVMRMAGYSPKTAIAPTKLTESKGFKELLASHLPLNNAFQATKDGLTANKIIGSPTEPDYEYPDHGIRLKAAEQVYKLHNVYNEDNIATGDINISYVIYSPDNARSSGLDASSSVQDAELAPQSPQNDSGNGEVNL